MAKYNKMAAGGKKYYRTRITMPDGSRHALYAKTQNELDMKVAKKRAEIAASKIDVADSGKACPTVAEYATLRLALIKDKVQYGTYIGYEAKVRLYIAAPPLGLLRMDAVTADDIDTALQPVSTQSSSTYHTVHMLIRVIFASAKRSHIIAEDPTDGLSSKGGKPKKDLPALSDKQVDILLATVVGLPVETFVLIGLYSGMRREEILALQWGNVYLDVNNPYIHVGRAWRIEHNRPVISDVLKSPAAKRDIPIPPILADHLRAKRDISASIYVISNAAGMALSGTQWRRLWQYVVTRTTKERTYTRYGTDGRKTTHTVCPKLGGIAQHNPDVKYTMDFSVTPHQLRRTYITNLIHAGADPKTVQYLAGHESSKITMDTYAKLKYHRPDDLAGTINAAFSARAGSI